MQRDILLLSEMVDAAEQAQRLVAGLSAAEVGADRMRRDSLLWNFTVLGAAVYRDLAADEARNQHVLTEVLTALARGRNCLVLTQWTTHVAVLADLLRATGHDPVVLKGGTGAGQRRDALARLRPDDGPLLVVATGP
jgi:hypothetical protein